MMKTGAAAASNPKAVGKLLLFKARASNFICTRSRLGCQECGESLLLLYQAAGGVHAVLG